MNSEYKNPFDIAKATDLTDRQISDYFVDFASEGSLIARVRATSPMPMFIFGGKGSGKTHLMRYLAYTLQLRRHLTNESALDHIGKEGYLGIYLRCSGLNSERFKGKGQSDEIWRAIFSYYTELWIAQVTLETVQKLFVPDLSKEVEAQIVSAVSELFDHRPPKRLATLNGLVKHIQKIKKNVDVKVNESAITRDLRVRIRASPGKLVFGIPTVITQRVPQLSSILFLYLLDEFENFSKEQQRYVNTIVRERELPVSLKIGVRLYGFRTAATLGADEVNREDSEYEPLYLDAELRSRPDRDQFAFATGLIQKRLTDAGYFHGVPPEHLQLADWFEEDDHDPILPSETKRVRDLYYDRDPPAIKELRNKLSVGVRSGAAPGLRSERDVEPVIRFVRNGDFPLVERTSIFLLYREWARGHDLLEGAETIANHAVRYCDRELGTLHAKALRHFRSDMVAQLLRDANQKQRYLGLATFVRMSGGLPRAFLTILKYVYKSSTFLGEQPFREGMISARAQIDGIAQASSWHFTDARAPGAIGAEIRDGMARLGELMRSIRFSDKPSESSLCTFSADLSSASENTVEILRQAENWSMLIGITRGQRDRNRQRVDAKYQIHPMLAPRWDLPISRRGAIGLSGKELDSIFSPKRAAEFEKTLERRTASMTAPYFGKPRSISSAQTQLPGLADG